mgnify:CR=1 FL=1
MRQGWNDVSGLMEQLRASFRPFMSIHIAVSLLIVVLLSPLSALLLRLSVLLSGDAALSDQDILFFILSPGGFMAFVALVSIFSIIVFLEYAAMIMVAWLVERGRDVSVPGVLKFLAGHAGRLFTLAVFILLRVLLYSVPFLAALGLVYLLLLTDYDINYYLFNKPAEWYMALALAALVLLAWGAMLLRLATGWIFCLPLLLLTDYTPKQTIKASVTFSKGHRLEILRTLLGWLLFNLFLVALASLLAGLLSLVLVPSTFETVQWLLLTMAFISLFGLLESFLVSFLSAAMLSLLILKLFNSFGLFREVKLDVFSRSYETLQFKVKPGLIAAGLSVGLLLAAGAVYGLVNQLKIESETEVMAHRGASAAAPENSIAAIKLAIESGAEWVEIDVQEAADGEIVVIHDSDLKKVGGVPMVVAESTMKQLQYVDIGSWFDLSFSDERLPTLRQVLELCKDQIGVNIELKYYGSEKRLEQSVAEIVDEVGVADQVVAMSLSLPGVREMKRIRPDWKVGLLSSVAVGNLARLDVDFLALNARFVNRSLIRRLHAQGKDVMVWTVNDPLGMSVMAGRGVDAIITDEPALAVDILRQRHELEPAQRLMLSLAELFDRPSLVKEQ